MAVPRPVSKINGSTPDTPATTKGKEFTNRFGLPTATALVVGSVIGTGVFALPSSLAPYGPSSLLAFVLITIGALALVFGWLNKRVPGSGGPYLYARDAFGDFGGFITAWANWLTAWIDNAAIVVAWVGYVESRPFPAARQQPEMGHIGKGRLRPATAAQSPLAA